MIKIDLSNANVGYEDAAKRVADYSVSLRDEINTSTTSRATLVYQKKHDQWRIVHAHFSNVPK
jgi:ketosteroid isomerase-like protein